jgi:hypothetical protein
LGPVQGHGSRIIMDQGKIPQTHIDNVHTTTEIVSMVLL